MAFRIIQVRPRLTKGAPISPDLMTCLSSMNVMELATTLFRFVFFGRQPPRDLLLREQLAFVGQQMA